MKRGPFQAVLASTWIDALSSKGDFNSINVSKSSSAEPKILLVVPSVYIFVPVDVIAVADRLFGFCIRSAYISALSAHFINFQKSSIILGQKHRK